MDSTLTKYLTETGKYVIRVCQYGNLFRAAVDDGLDTWVSELPFRDTEKDAQRDLDELATKYNLRIEANQ